jgi:hypothetical protein
MELHMLASTKWTHIATALVLALGATFPGPAFPAPAALSSIENQSALKLQRGDCFWTDWNGQPSDAVFPDDVLQKF